MGAWSGRGLGARSSGFGIRCNKGEMERIVTWFMFLEIIRFGVPELRPVGETLKEDRGPRVAQGSGQHLARLLHPVPYPKPFPQGHGR